MPHGDHRITVITPACGAGNQGSIPCGRPKMQKSMKNSKRAVHKIAQDVFLIWKKLGETPLQALERLRAQEGLGSDIKMTYAGRLDPLAEGELLILIGEECKQKEKYLGLDKEYEVEILLGAQTDTGDVMGVVSREVRIMGEFSDNVFLAVLRTFIGKVSWAYPAFSSKTVQGKPLFLWALEGKIGEIEIPVRESEIYELELLGSEPITLSELRERVHQNINSIKSVLENVESKRLGADFRRVEVLKSWADFFTQTQVNRQGEFEVIKIRCKCSSGTYMRTLAQKVGEELGTPALALSIVRTRIMVE